MFVRMLFLMGKAEQLVDEIGFLIVGNPRLSALGWHHLVFVANMESGRSRMSGFAYAPGGTPRPATPDDMEVINRISALRNVMTRESGRPWSVCLIRVQRHPARIAVDFEYDDAARWTITPANVRQMAEALKPLG